jgi:hypothetical protein
MMLGVSLGREHGQSSSHSHVIQSETATILEMFVISCSEGKTTRFETRKATMSSDNVVGKSSKKKFESYQEPTWLWHRVLSD